MYKNNFDEVFERVYGAFEFERYTRQMRDSVVVKWAAYIGTFVFIVVIMKITGIKLTDLGITVFALFRLFLAPLYWLIVSKLGSRTLSDTVFHSLLVNVLDGCFDEEVTLCGSGLDRAEYEKSAPEGRYKNFDSALFKSSDLALTVRSGSAEITVCEAAVTDMNTNICDGGFDSNISVTGMIFAAARFPKGQVPFNKETAYDKTYTAVYGSRLYIEIDGRSLSVGAGTKKAVRKNCLDVCESIERILKIVGRR